MTDTASCDGSWSSSQQAAAASVSNRCQVRKFRRHNWLVPRGISQHGQHFRCGQLVHHGLGLRRHQPRAVLPPIVTALPFDPFHHCEERFLSIRMVSPSIAMQTSPPNK